MERVKRAMKSPQGERFRRDKLYRAQVMLGQGLMANLAYAAAKAGFGIAYRSVWFGILAAYYLLLALMRLLLVVYVRRTPIGQNPLAEWRRYRLCGICLVAMNQALAAVAYRMVFVSEGFRYPGVLIYAMALYTFYAFVIAIVNMVRFQKYNSPVMSAAKGINFVAALVSMLSLETAMLTEFTVEGDELFSKITISLSGLAVCIAVLVLAVHMIQKSTCAIRAFKQ